MASAIGDETRPSKKSKHRKEVPEKSKTHRDEGEKDGPVDEPEKETSKKEKKKRKHNGDMQKDGAVLAEEDAVTSKPEKKKRKRNNEINDEEAGTAGKTSPTKKQKKTHKSDGREPTDSKKKKSKLSGGDTPQSTKPLKKSKKKRKNKTGFLDPEQDEETDLPEQARKALSYAFCRFYDPDNWKFNKARQNWLVRNLWNFQSLPKRYEDLVVKYLSAVQGNTRDNMLKTCQKTLDQSNANEVSDKSASGGGPIINTPTPSDSDDHRKARAQALLEALSLELAS